MVYRVVVQNKESPVALGEELGKEVVPDILTLIRGRCRFLAGRRDFELVAISKVLHQIEVMERVIGHPGTEQCGHRNQRVGNDDND